jgi:hypothetical protein
MRANKTKGSFFKAKNDIQEAARAMRQLPVPALLSSIEMQIGILAEREIEIKDWEYKDRTLKQVRMIGGKAYFLAAGETENKSREE